MALVIAPKIVPSGRDPCCCADVYVVTDEGASAPASFPGSRWYWIEKRGNARRKGAAFPLYTEISS